jgi:DNA processing protein
VLAQEFSMSKVHWLALMSVPGIGGVTARRLVDRLGSIEAVLNASPADLKRIPRVSAEIAQSIRRASLEASLETIEEGVSSLLDEGIEVVTWDDDDYPANLRTVNDAPPVLYVRGDLLASDAEAVAIVGSRDATAQGLEVADRLAYELAGRGLTVVSGLAQGVDTAAHQGALRARRGRTLAILGSGLRAIFPRENVPLAEAVSAHGALVSELGLGVPASGPTLMARDRIVSGLSRAVIVVEAAEKSGSMDTARRAIAQSRLLFAVPGSPGTRLLLAGEAEPVDMASADLDALAQRIRNQPACPSDTQQLGLGV